jgi:Putative Flp pilus-assembly TadE/G-like
MRFKDFDKNDRGAVAVIFAFALIPVLGFAGAAVDYVRAMQSRGKVQAAVDGAALAAVLAQVPTVAERQATAQKVFGAIRSEGLTATPAFSITNTTATVTASGQVETSLLKVLHVPQIPIASRAKAMKAFGGPPPCILALNRSVDKALLLTGGAQYLAEGCVLHSNSSSSLSLVVDNNAAVQAGGYCASGKASVPSTLTPPARSYCEPIEDPFRNLTAPMAGSCVATNLEVTPKQTVTLNPGTYCGGLTIKGTATLNPGVYIISGLLTVTSQATIKGAGVTFYLTGATAGFTLQAGATIDLSAPTSGPYGGILFFQDRLANPGFVNLFAGNSDTKVFGSIYAPTQKVRVAGTSGVSQDVPFLPIIADQIEITGNIKAKAVAASVQLPFPLPKTENGARLVE